MLSDYTVKHIPPDMREAEFLGVLRGAGSPVPEQDARNVYAYCASRQFSPAFLLAMFHHESTYGKFGSAAETHSWGNTRPPAFGADAIGVTARNFSIFRNWTDGGISTVARLLDYSPYIGKNTVRAIIPIWAPPIENSTENYIVAVLSDIERWVAVPQPPGALTIHEAIVPLSNANRPGIALTGGRPQWITVHETANFSVGADAEMHKDFVHNGGGSEGVSFHYVVDDHEVYHLIPDDEVAWHAGDGYNGPGNNTSIAVETCVNSDGDWSRTRANLAILTATLMRRHGIALDRVVQHNHWSGKNCPLIMRRDGLWAGQLAATKVAYETMATPLGGGIYAAHAAKWRGGIYAAQEALWR